MNDSWIPACIVNADILAHCTIYLNAWTELLVGYVFPFHDKENAILKGTAFHIHSEKQNSNTTMTTPEWEFRGYDKTMNREQQLPPPTTQDPKNLLPMYQVTQDTDRRTMSMSWKVRGNVVITIFIFLCCMQILYWVNVLLYRTSFMCKCKK